MWERYFGFLCISLTVLWLPSVNSQAYQTRPCYGGATLQASRCLGGSNVLAASACSAYCSSSNVSTSSGLGNYICSAANKTCGLTSYCVNAPLLYNQTVVPTLTALNGTSITVPCGYAYTSIGTLLGVTGGGNQTYYINKQVVASSPSDTNPAYILFNANGTIIRGASGPAVTTQQTISFTASQYGSAIFSNTVNITFTFQSCALQVSCPNTTFYDCVNQNTSSYIDGLTCTITNYPGIPVVWDEPSPGGAGASSGVENNGQNGMPYNGFNAPAIAGASPATLPDDGSNQLAAIYIQSYNQVADSSSSATPPVPIINPNGPVGLYGYNAGQGEIQQGCQALRFSATPLVPSSTPYTTGTFIGQVCCTTASNNGAAATPAPVTQ